MSSPAPPVNPVVNNLVTSLIRTIVPALAGWLIGWGAQRGLAIEATQLTYILNIAAMALYYGTARVLEERVRPWFGWLLGRAKQPVYVNPPALVRDQGGSQLVEKAGDS